MASRHKFRTLVLARRGQTVQHVGQVSDFLPVAGAVNREVCRGVRVENGNLRRLVGPVRVLAGDQYRCTLRLSHANWRACCEPRALGYRQ